MHRYYLFPQLKPKGTYYLLKRTPSPAPGFDQQKTAWDGVIEYLLQKKWYRRFPFRIKEPWLSWELHATEDQLHYYYWAPDEKHGYEIAQRLAVVDPTLEIVEAPSPEPLPFDKQSHYGYKLQLEKNFCLPTSWGTSLEPALHEYLSKLKAGQRIVCQFLLRPVYDYQVTRAFTKALHSLGGSKTSLHAAVFQKQQQKKAEVAIRLVAFAETIEEAKDILEPCVQLLSASDSDEHNTLQWREWWRIIRPLFRYEFQHKLFPFRKKENAIIMGTDELARLIHPPDFRQGSKVQWLGGARVAEPLDLRKQRSRHRGVQIGLMEKNLNVRPNQLSIHQLERHFAVFGGPQTGKTTTLLNMLLDYAKLRTDENRFGFTLIDIQGKLANQLLARMPESQHHLLKIVRFKRGQYPFNWFDMDFAGSDHQKARIVLEIFRRLGKGNWTPFVSDHLLYGAQALLKLGRANLYNLQLLIEDNEFCQKVINELDPSHPIEASMIRFFKRYLQNKEDSNWREEFFLSSIIMRLREINLSGLSDSLNFYSNGLRWVPALDEGHFHVLDLSALNPGDRPRTGLVTIALFQAAMLSREQKFANGEYLPLHPLIVDDVAAFINTGFGDLEYFFHEAKKYRMPVWMSLPGVINYVDPTMAESIFRNVETILSYRLANATDAEFVASHMHTIGLTAEDFQNLDPYFGYLQTVNKLGQRTYAFTNRGYLPKEPFISQAKIDELEMNYLGEISQREQNWQMKPWKTAKELEQIKQKLKNTNGLDEYLQLLYGDQLGNGFLKPF
jgi:hypothetical protein